MQFFVQLLQVQKDFKPRQNIDSQNTQKLIQMNDSKTNPKNPFLFIPIDLICHEIFSFLYVDQIQNLIRSSVLSQLFSSTTNTTERDESKELGNICSNSFSFHYHDLLRIKDKKLSQYNVQISILLARLFLFDGLILS